MKIHPYIPTNIYNTKNQTVNTKINVVYRRDM
jgi:hypothetical protein